MKESNLIKYTSVVLITLGAVEAVAAVSDIFNGRFPSTAALVTGGIFTLLVGLSELISGIFGYLARAKVKRMKACIVFGIVIASLIALAGAASLLFYPAGFSLFTLLELILPALYLTGAVLYPKQRAKNAAKKAVSQNEGPEEGGEQL